MAAKKKPVVKQKPVEKKKPVEKEKPPRLHAAVLHEDGRRRCPWPGHDPLYVAYHDEEWGVPEWDDRALFEKLILDGFQAGLSWITILRKREAFRAAFDGFDPKKIVRYDEAKIAALMQDPGIVRNRAKIVAAIALARIYLDLAPQGGFARHLWSFVDGRPVQNARRSMHEMAAQTKVSEAIAKDLRARGGNFVGPTIVYAFMQATGMVNDHLVDCHRYGECEALGRAPRGW
jgi:DNA-3-methyladenine glycosylase I